MLYNYPVLFVLSCSELLSSCKLAGGSAPIYDSSTCVAVAVLLRCFCSQHQKQTIWCFHSLTRSAHVQFFSYHFLDQTRVLCGCTFAQSSLRQLACISFFQIPVSFFLWQKLKPENESKLDCWRQRAPSCDALMPLPLHLSDVRSKWLLRTGVADRCNERTDKKWRRPCWLVPWMKTLL